MNIVIAGGTGLIGTALSYRLVQDGHRVFILTRRPSDIKDTRLTPLAWDAMTLGPWQSGIESADAVVNLTGESIGAGRWTRRRKERIVTSRIGSTRVIVSAIRQATRRPAVLINASGVGYYGNVPEGDVTEAHPAGDGFLAETCARWETEARAAEQAGIRVVLMRNGVVFAKHAPAFKKIILPFQLFAGGHLGSGRQWFPWIHLTDVVEALLFALKNEALAGAVNLVAPETVTYKTLSTRIGRVMHRPAWAPVPAFVLKLALGELSSMVLTGQKVIPKKLQDAGYRFRFPELKVALRDVLAK